MAHRTALWDAHAALGATMTEFAGYDMPVVYGSIRDEHAAVRERCGLFDVSHMSNLFLSGPGAAAAVSRVTTKDVSDLPVGRGQYGTVLRADATIVDDVFTFRLEEERWMMVPNAGQNDVVAAHLERHAPEPFDLRDETADWAILALQGPAAKAVLGEAAEGTPPKFHRIAGMRLAGADCLVSGTGYTGEKGVEVFVPADRARAVWDHLLAVGAAHGISPVGLGARDTLRLEKGYCLAGNEFAGGRTPLEAGLGWLVDWEHDFLGRDALAAQRDGGDHDRLVGLVQEKGIPRAGYRVLRSADGGDVGTVTSGTLSPTLGKGIALAYCRGVAPGDEVSVDVRGRPQAALVRQPPFV